MSTHHQDVSFIGYASGVGGAYPSSADGPIILQKSAYLKDVNSLIEWKFIYPSQSNLSKLAIITQQCKQLSNQVIQLIKQKKFFIVLGGDHSCAIGTWSGVHQSVMAVGDLGLIWIDAHMDSHTPQTTRTGNIHGMPLACLLGDGEPDLIHLQNAMPKLKPENVCLIAVRSYEAEEEKLLKNLNVRIYFMEEVKERGIQSVMQEAIEYVKKRTVHFGVSLDIDSIDPQDAPGTGLPVPNGIKADDLYQALQLLGNEEKLVGFEIAEFDPHRDKNHLTEKLIGRILRIIA